MNFFARYAVVCVAAILMLTSLSRADAPKPVRTVELWPGAAPGEKGDLGEEKVQPPRTGESPVTRLTNVSKPTLAFYAPPKDKDTGAAVILCPGGGYSILAIDKEGDEALQKASVPAQLHLFAQGGHGFGLRLGPHAAPTAWPKLCADWFRQRKLLTNAVTSNQ